MKHDLATVRDEENAVERTVDPVPPAVLVKRLHQTVERFQRDVAQPQVGRDERDHEPGGQGQENEDNGDFLQSYLDEVPSPCRKQRKIGLRGFPGTP